MGMLPAVFTKARRPKDGDGDGRCREGETPGGVPCVPGMPERVVSELWGRAQAKRLQQRRAAVQRAKLRERRRTTPPDAAEIIEAGRSGRTEDLQEMMADVFDMEDLGRLRVKAEVQSVYAIGPDMPDQKDWFQNEVGAMGVFLDDRGRPVGRFQRWFAEENGVLKVKHEELVIEDPYKGFGIGGDFIADTQSKYPEMGVEEIHVDAALDDGPYTWAVAGFDWKDEENRMLFLGYMEEALAAYRSGDRPELFSDAQEAAAIQALIQRSMDEGFEDPDRLTPYAFTLFSGARAALTRQDRTSRGSRAWEGVRRLTPEA